MTVICYGDSNTYGYDPRSFFGERYSKDCRWVDILADKTGWDIHNQGMNGREIPHYEPQFPENTDLLIIMLGTNDLLQGNRPEEVANRMRVFLTNVTVDKRNILLIAPPPMQIGEWVPDERLINASKQLVKCYYSLAQGLGIQFADARAWNIPMAFDGVHFTEDGHRVFAEMLLSELKNR